MKAIKTVGGEFIIRFPYNPALVQSVKSLPGRRYDTKQNCWRVPVTQASGIALINWAVSNGFDVTPEVQGAVERASKLSDLLYEASHAKDDPLETLPGMMPFQRAGVAYAMATRKCMIADAMGLGKTVQGLAWLEGLQAYPAVIVCPASVKLNWQKEAARWLPGRTCAVLQGMKAEVPDVDIIITNYDLFGRGVSRGRNDAGKIITVFPFVEKIRSKQIKAVVLDESHYCKNPDAKRTKACKELASGIENRLLLTGTPVLNRPYELVSQMQVLGVLNTVFGTKRAFLDTYCVAQETQFGTVYTGGKNLKELNRKMRSSFFIRRLKSDVLTDLPEKNRAYVPIELDNRSEYKRAERDLIKWIHENEGIRAAQRAAAAEHLVRIEKLKQLAVRGKMAGAVSWLKDFLDNSEEKIVIFATHKFVIEQIATALHDYGVVTIAGDTAQAARQAAVETFQTDARTRVFVGNLKAAGVGITLTAASNVAFLELGWTPADHDQAEDRCHRMTQSEPVTAWYLMAAATIDDDITELLDNKRTIVDQATDGMDAKQSAGVLNDLVDKLSKRR